MNFEELQKRKGSFRISWELIRESPQAVKKILGRMVIVKAESLFIEDSIEYYAYSEMFEPLTDGCTIPKYDICVPKDGNIIATL